LYNNASNPQRHKKGTTASKLIPVYRATIGKMREKPGKNNSRTGAWLCGSAWNDELAISMMEQRTGYKKGRSYRNPQFIALVKVRTGNSVSNPYIYLRTSQDHNATMYLTSAIPKGSKLSRPYGTLE
jgi:hypothetical protein